MSRLLVSLSFLFHINNISIVKTKCVRHSFCPNAVFTNSLGLPSTYLSYSIHLDEGYCLLFETPSITSNCKYSSLPIKFFLFVSQEYSFTLIVNTPFSEYDKLMTFTLVSTLQGLFGILYIILVLILRALFLPNRSSSRVP